jgi:hypothetical protein
LKKKRFKDVIVKRIKRLKKHVLSKMNFEVNDLEFNEGLIIFKNNEKQLILSILHDCCEEAYFENIPVNVSISRLEELGYCIDECDFIPLDNLKDYKDVEIDNIDLIWEKTITCKIGDIVDDKTVNDYYLEYKLYEINLNNDKKSYIILKVISNGYYSSTLNTEINDI